jgi:hypothetical protein
MPVCASPLCDVCVAATLNQSPQAGEGGNLCLTRGTTGRGDPSG